MSRWAVIIRYERGHESVVDILDSELKAFALKKEIESEYWFTKRDSVFTREIGEGFPASEQDR